MKITKLDKRHAGGYAFKYCVNFTYKDSQRYADQRAWCWETWGASTELEFYGRTNPKNPHWAWICDNHRVRLYLATDREASHYLLRWGDQ